MRTWDALLISHDGIADGMIGDAREHGLRALCRQHGALPARPPTQADAALEEPGTLLVPLHLCGG